VLSNDEGEGLMLCMQDEDGDADWGHVFPQDGYLVYQSAWGENDSFTYTVCDEDGNMATATVHIEASTCNAEPDANTDNETTNQGESITIDVMANDDDPDGDGLTPCPVINDLMPNHGSAVLNSDGTITYTPNPEFVGLDIFAYTICDGNNDSDRTKVYVMVQGPCDLQTPELCIAPGETIEICLEFCIESVQIEDYDVEAIGEVFNGANNCFSYTATDFEGLEELSFEACEENDFCETTNVLIEINDMCDGAFAQANDPENKSCDLEHMMVPTLFSPNGDGINDMWSVKNQPDCFMNNQIKVQVYNRWGAVVMTNENIIRGDLWNGNVNEGNAGLADGTYFYFLEYTNEEGLQTKSGFVQIIR